MIVKLLYFIQKSFSAFTIYPFIIIRNNSDKTNHTLINHEKIHLKQQLELLIIFFYIIYLFEFIYHYIRFISFMKAYRNISFEREAYLNERNSNYFKTRKPYSFLQYPP